MTRPKPLAMYTQTERGDIEALVRVHAPLVKKIALHLLARLPDSVQLDDLIQAGMIGLLEAAGKFENSHGASFETYAGIRIRGAIVDEIRKGDWVPRSVHRNSRRVAAAIRNVEAREGRDARDAEVAEEMELSLEEFHQCVSDSNKGRLFSLDELTENGEGPGVDSQTLPPERALQDSHFKQQLAECIGNLPERERLVLALYYQEDMNLREIGAVLNVSESRVSQIHGQAAARLRARLSDWQ
ncbi:MAG: RNA polymerase sigma factor FliA [Halomonadaceae bacterium]|nr:MAG: RNA polymerase sigma factor FliA [Halomonadaceae bacterium]